MDGVLQRTSPERKEKRKNHVSTIDRDDVGNLKSLKIIFSFQRFTGSPTPDEYSIQGRVHAHYDLYHYSDGSFNGSSVQTQSFSAIGQKSSSHWQSVQTASFQYTIFSVRCSAIETIVQALSFGSLECIVLYLTKNFGCVYHRRIWDSDSSRARQGK
jgi:hypothetical protein